MQIVMESKDSLAAHAGSGEEGGQTLSAHGARTVIQSS